MYQQPKKEINTAVNIASLYVAPYKDGLKTTRLSDIET